MEGILAFPERCEGGAKCALQKWCAEKCQAGRCAEVARSIVSLEQGLGGSPWRQELKEEHSRALAKMEMRVQKEQMRMKTEAEDLKTKLEEEKRDIEERSVKRLDAQRREAAHALDKQRAEHAADIDRKDEALQLLKRALEQSNARDEESTRSATHEALHAQSVAHFQYCQQREKEYLSKIDEQKADHAAVVKALRDENTEHRDKAQQGNDKTVQLHQELCVSKNRIQQLEEQALHAETNRAEAMREGRQQELTKAWAVCTRSHSQTTAKEIAKKLIEIECEKVHSIHKQGDIGEQAIEDSLRLAGFPDLRRVTRMPPGKGLGIDFLLDVKGAAGKVNDLLLISVKTTRHNSWRQWVADFADKFEKNSKAGDRTRRLHGVIVNVHPSSAITSASYDMDEERHGRDGVHVHQVHDLRWPPSRHTHLPLLYVVE